VRASVLTVCAANNGIITLQSQIGYILGLFIYDLRDDLQEGGHSRFPILLRPSLSVVQRSHGT
jgi:hypothetical protein